MRIAINKRVKPTEVGLSLSMIMASDDGRSSAAFFPSKDAKFAGGSKLSGEILLSEEEIFSFVASNAPYGTDARREFFQRLEAFVESRYPAERFERSKES